MTTTDGTKVCSGCRAAQPVALFAVDQQRRDGLSLRCRPCRVVLYHATDDGWLKQLTVRYGLSSDAYLAMVSAQDNRCASCRRPESRRSRPNGPIKRLAVDHDHDTGEIRGLLCHDCNLALGYLADDAERVAALLTYIEGHTQP